ncbi:MAG: ATP-binding protein, partial [Hyphomicrobiaceae bacterium]
HWLLTFEELVEVLIGDPTDRKQEVEMLQELVPVCKSKYGAATRGQQGKLARASLDTGRYTVDTPVPWRIADLTNMIDERMGRLENKRDLAPFRALKTRIDTITKDQRYGFMFGGITVDDIMADVLGRIFRVPVNDRPITILELTGLPTEIVNVVVSVLCRMTFDFALWGDGKVPVTIVCEEAHRYVPGGDSAKSAFEPAKRAIARIAKEGRKYGASLCIITQRPAEIDPTILSQCNTVFALRMSNDRDQEIVRSAISDTGSGLLEFLPALGAREAIAFGDGVTLPVRIKFHELPQEALPKSSTAKFSEKWQQATDDMDLIHMIVDRWRVSGHSEPSDTPEEGGYTDQQAESFGASQYPMMDAPQPTMDHVEPVAPAHVESQQTLTAEPEAPAEERPRLRRREPAGDSGTDEGLRSRLRRRDSQLVRND